MHSAAYYRDNAARFRELAKDTEESTARALTGLARDYDTEAKRLEPHPEPPMPSV